MNSSSASPSHDSIDLTTALIAFPGNLTRREHNALRMLVEEIEKRTQIRLAMAEGLPPAETSAIWISRPGDVPAGWKTQLPGLDGLNQAEGYLVQSPG